MVLYLKMDQKTWATGDFTNSATYDLSGTVYDENTLTTARNISSFTGTLRLINQDGDNFSFDGCKYNILRFKIEKIKTRNPK